MASQAESDPADGIRQVGTVVVRVRRPGGREPEQQREAGPAEGRETEREPTQRTNAYCDLGQRDHEPNCHRERLAQPNQPADRRGPGKGRHLRLDRRGARWVEEGRGRQLVEPGVEEGRAEEEAEGQEARGGDELRGDLIAEGRLLVRQPPRRRQPVANRRTGPGAPPTHGRRTTRRRSISFSHLPSGTVPCRRLPTAGGFRTVGTVTIPTRSATDPAVPRRLAESPPS